jgi:hypothetical protein
VGIGKRILIAEPEGVASDRHRFGEELNGIRVTANLTAPAQQLTYLMIRSSHYSRESCDQQSLKLHHGQSDLTSR